MSVSVAAVAIGSLFIGAGVGFMLGARQARSDAQAVASEAASKTPRRDTSSDADVTVSADEPRLNPREELKMTFVCPCPCFVFSFRQCHAHSSHTRFFFCFFFHTSGQVVRQDLHMGKGKTAAQCCHACLGVYKRALKMRPAHVRAWNQGQAKVVLRVETVEELFVISFLPSSLSISSSRTHARTHTS